MTRLEAARREARMTLRDAARLSGVRAMVLRAHERTGSKPPRRVLRKLAAAYGTTINMLVGFVVAAPPFRTEELEYGQDRGFTPEQLEKAFMYCEDITDRHFRFSGW